jgi:hypothetical protein
MAKTKISEFDANSANNTDIDGINLAEGMAPGLVNNAIRELMAQLKDFQVGSAGDNVTVGGNLSVTGTSALTGNVTITGTATMSGRAVDAFPSGTKMTFQQTSAPTGWTKDTTHDNKALRVVSGTAGSGGSVNFTTAFGSQNVGATTLDATQIPGHDHTFSATSSSVNLSHSHGGATSNTTLSGTFRLGGPNQAPSGVFSAGGDTGARPGLDNNSGSQHIINFSAPHTHPISADLGAHTHTVSGTTASTGGGSSHTHSLDLAVSYVDLIICTKT